MGGSKVRVFARYEPGTPSLWPRRRCCCESVRCPNLLVPDIPRVRILRICKMIQTVSFGESDAFGGRPRVARGTGRSSDPTVTESP